MGTEQLTNPAARDPYIVKAALARNAALMYDAPELSGGHKGALINRLNEHAGGDLQRTIALAWLFEYGEGPYHPLVPKSSKTLSNGQWQAISLWMDTYQDENLEWRVSETFISEFQAVVRLAIGLYESTSMVARDPLFNDSALLEEALNMGAHITPYDPEKEENETETE